MPEQAQPQFTSQSLTAAWDDTAAAIHQLLTGEYPRGLNAADRTFLLKRSVEHLRAYLQPQIGALLAAEMAAQQAAQQAAEKAAEQAGKDCPECPPKEKPNAA